MCIRDRLGPYAAPIQVHDVPAANRTLQKRYGADVPSIVLVRPDGHIAFRGDAIDIVPLTRYLDRWFVRRAAPEADPAPLLQELVAR